MDMEKILPSFGRRKARKLRPQAQQAYEKLEKIKWNPQEKAFNLSPQEVWLEIGFGGGEHLLARLRENPTIRFIGCEPFTNGIAKLLAQLLPEEEKRLRIWPEDVRYILDKFPQDYFSRVFILFPDPWPKKRHHRRKLINKPFLTQLLSHIKDKGELYMASDSVAYVEHIHQVILSFPELTLVEGAASVDSLDWEKRPETWPPTRYEQKALAQGNPCAYMRFKKE